MLVAPKHYVIQQWRRLGNHIWTWLLLCMTSRHLETILSLAYQVWYFPIFVDLFMSISYCIWYHLIWEKSYIDYRTSDSYFSDLDVTVFHYIYQFLTMETTHEYTRYHTTTVYTNVRHRRSLYIFTRCFLASTWSSLELRFVIIWLPYYILNALWTFANESESAKYWYPNPTGFTAEITCSQRQDQRTVKSRTSQTSHFSPTVKTKAGLFRLHQQHTQPEYSWRRTDLPNDRQGDIYLPG